MSRRRFMLLAVTLVALNSFFWIAQGGFALPRAIIDQYFGQRMIRAEVVVQSATGGGDDYLIDRGSIKTVAPGSITLKEKDGRVVTVPIATTAAITGGAGHGRGTGALRVGLRVLVIRIADAPAATVQVEGVGP